MSSALAPLALIAGFTVGAARQPASYRSVHDTISALAARGATDRWIMSVAFVLLGLCHLVTAAGLRRPLLAVGGLGTALIGFAPQPVHGSSDLHLVLAAISLSALAVWDVRDGRRGLTATAVLVLLLALFAVTLQLGDGIGLTERVLTSAEAVWPIFVVRAASGRTSPHPS